MKYELLVLDIDGTVTNSQKEVLPETREAVRRIQKAGIKVVLASGRPPEGVFPIARELGFEEYESYILSFNGGKILDVRTGECIFEKVLPGYLPGRLWEDAVRNQVGIAIYQPGKIIAGTMLDTYLKMESKIMGMPLEYCENFRNRASLPVNECLITGEPDVLENLEPVFSHKYFHEAQVFHSEPWYLEVTPKNVDKAYGLKYLLKRLGIERERMVCCGDSFNDIAMICHAGLGVAMANAPDAVQMVADYVTKKDNNHNGIKEVIERFFPGL